MKITRKSKFTGVVRTRDLPITELQIEMFANGALIQHAFPNLSASDREFVLTGVTDEEWKQALGPEDLDD